MPAILSPMAGSDRRLDRALRLSRELVVEAGREILLGRDQAGLSQKDAASAVGMSSSQFGRIERAELRRVSVEQLARAASAVGLRASLRLYPDGDAVRDAAHVRLLERLRRRLPVQVAWRTEVPPHGQRDLRSWDAQIWHAAGRDAVEAETRIRDAQATWRRTAMKLRDDPTVDHVVLLLADTPANRRAMALVRELLRVDCHSKVAQSSVPSRPAAAREQAACCSFDPARGSPDASSDGMPTRRPRRRGSKLANPGIG